MEKAEPEPKDDLVQSNPFDSVQTKNTHSLLYLIIIVILLLTTIGLIIALVSISNSKDETEEDKKQKEETVPLPLIDLHYHLDGGLTVEIARKLAEMQGLQSILPEKDEELKKELVFDYDPSTSKDEGLNQYLTKFKLPGQLMQTTTGIKQAIILQSEALKKQGVVYAEMRFAPQIHTENGLTQEEVIEAAIEALKETAIPVNLILCAMRGDDEETINGNNETIELAGKYLVKDHGVVAVDLAGAEALYKTENFKDLFAKAKELNVPITIHAGEADNYESVDSALKMGALRIGAGISARDSEETMEKIKKLEVYIDISPTANVHTHAVEKLEDSPIKFFMEKGIKVTINTDNTGVSNVNLKDEFALVEKTFGLTKEEKISLVRNAIFAAFCGMETKQMLFDLLAKY